jgi:hypothetical protein
MRQHQFEESHAAEWDEFEKFLDAKEKKPVFDPAEMPVRYRRICQSLALAADRQYSPELVDRLNQLALRGHHALYRNRRRESQRVLEFLLAGFPALVRAEWRLVAAASLLFFGPLLGLIAVLQAYPRFVHYLLAPEQIANFHQMYDPANKRLGSREADSSLMMFGFHLEQHPHRLPDLRRQAARRRRLDLVPGRERRRDRRGGGILTQVGYTQTFWSFVASHSSLELSRSRSPAPPALRLGMAVISPGNRAAARPGRRGQACGAPDVRRGDDVPRRGVRRAFCRRSRFGFQIKIGVGIAGWTVLLSYFLLAGGACSPLTSR